MIVIRKLDFVTRYMFGRTRFLDGFEVHFLCEYTGYWHMTEDVGFWLGTPPQLQRSAPSTSGSSGGSASTAGKRTTQPAAGPGGMAGGSQVAVLLNLALSFVQVVHGIPEHGNNCRLVAPVVAALLKSYDYLRAVDAHAQPDTYVARIQYAVK